MSGPATPLIRYCLRGEVEQQQGFPVMRGGNSDGDFSVTRRKGRPVTGCGENFCDGKPGVQVLPLRFRMNAERIGFRGGQDNEQVGGVDRFDFQSGTSIQSGRLETALLHIMKI